MYNMDSYTILCNLDDPYGPQVKQFILSRFPSKHGTSGAELLDLLTEAIMASGQVRYGPRPSPEGLVRIREVVKYHLAMYQPIPIIIPWGSEKPDGSGVDLAELYALKTLTSLQERLVKHYPPGAVFYPRLEDVSAPHLFYDKQEAAREEARRYSYGFINLVHILSLDTFIIPVLESTKVSEYQFNTAADHILPMMERYLTNPIGSTESEVGFSMLVSNGWKGRFSQEVLDYHMDSYARLYPTATLPERAHRLARYFTGALVRKNLGLTAVDPSWQGNYLDLYFGQPIPNDIRLNRIHYRTIPSTYTSMHISPWRAKGYLEMSEAGARPRLTSFREPLPYIGNTITLQKGTLKQVIQSDYIIL